MDTTLGVDDGENEYIGGVAPGDDGGTGEADGDINYGGDAPSAGAE